MLKGLKILVTRPLPQAKKLALLIEQHGGEAVIFPTLAIEPVNNEDTIVSQLEKLSNYHWLIFISANAVNFAQRANKNKNFCFESVKIAAIGKATAKALENIGLTVDLMPDAGFNSEALLLMPELQSLDKQNILIVRGEGGRETLAKTLQQRGAKVNYLEVYKRCLPKINDDTLVIKLLKQRKLNAITITSGDGLNNLMSLLAGRIIAPLILETPLIVISTRIKKIAVKIGFKHVLVSASPADIAIIKTVTTVCNGEDCGGKSN